MSRKWLIVLILVAIVVALLLVKSNEPWPVVENQTPDVNQVQKYESAKYGISFNYPETYYLEEKDTSTGARYRYDIILTEDTEENRQLRNNPTSTPPREGPVAITVSLHQNYLDNQSIAEWVKGSSFSNYKLRSNDQFATTSVAGTEAVSYDWSGLYEGRSYVFEHNGYIVMASVTFLTPEDRIVKDFDNIIESLKLAPLTETEAISVVKDRYPELRTYPGDTLPPKTINATRLSDNSGWGLVFAENGSGLPGILKARCFTVSDDRTLKSTGTFTRTGNQGANTVDPLTCKAI